VGIEDYAETQARLAAAADRLESEFEGIYDRAAIERLLGKAAQDFSGRGVESFVAILAERFTRERLRAQAQTEGKLAKGTIEVLFVSLTGGGRAQIAAAMFAQASGTQSRSTPRARPPRPRSTPTSAKRWPRSAST
jgi:arsenate reductase